MCRRGSRPRPPLGRCRRRLAHLDASTSTAPTAHLSPSTRPARPISTRRSRSRRPGPTSSCTTPSPTSGSSSITARRWTPRHGSGGSPSTCPTSEPGSTRPRSPRVPPACSPTGRGRPSSSPCASTALAPPASTASNGRSCAAAPSSPTRPSSPTSCRPSSVNWRAGSPPPRTPAGHRGSSSPSRIWSRWTGTGSCGSSRASPPRTTTPACPWRQISPSPTPCSPPTTGCSA